MGQKEITQNGVEGEAGYPLADRQHQHGGRAVDRVTGRNLVAAGLQEIRRGSILARRRRTQDREDRADGDVHVNVGRAIQRVEHQQVLAAGVASRQRNG
ncbi:hypothetical protein SDC9_176140 [bioreactor metagenome]|uniref:Uncharacterized protein n=1 Tax=bioreactor metagenome TaxID=1076179 RepID=A0A645GPU7_9ZZZZ